MRLHKLSSMILAVAMVLTTNFAQGQTHAPWPTDWNNWSDPALLVTVGDPGNAPDTHGAGYGSVGYAYNIGKYEVTAGQYTAFLNAVAKTDPYGLYNRDMDIGWGCQITQHGDSGSYTYDFSGRPSGVESDWANRPVNYVSWGDAARFVNWLQNGQPTGTLTGTPSLDGWLTEDGTYCLNGATTNTALMAVTRKPGMKWWIPSEDEWYKAAYYDPNKLGGADYWDYPTKSDIAPKAETPAGTDMLNGSANYDWAFAYGGTSVVGAYSARPSTSPYGTFDQGGNVWEWNEAIQNASSRRGARGGCWTAVPITLQASNRTSGFAPPTYEANIIGFRVAGVPEPSSVIMLAGIASTALLYWWRKRA